MLLLDDILSELDKQSRRYVLELMKDRQTILTTASPEAVSEVKADFPQVEVIKLNHQTPQ